MQLGFQTCHIKSRIQSEQWSCGGSCESGKEHDEKKKYLYAKEDPYLGLLNLRNTPEEGMISSPTQRPMGRYTNTALPTMSKLLQPTVADYIKQEKNCLGDKRQTTAYCHCNQKDLRPLTSGEQSKFNPLTSHGNHGKVASSSTDR